MANDLPRAFKHPITWPGPFKRPAQGPSRHGFFRPRFDLRPAPPCGTPQVSRATLVRVQTSTREINSRVKPRDPDWASTWTSTIGFGRISRREFSRPYLLKKQQQAKLVQLSNTNCHYFIVSVQLVSRKARAYATKPHTTSKRDADEALVRATARDVDASIGANTIIDHRDIEGRPSKPKLTTCLPPSLHPSLPRLCPSIPHSPAPSIPPYLLRTERPTPPTQ